VSISSHWCFCGLCVIHPKLFEQVLSVLRLGDECSFLELFHLKSKEVGQLPHHEHLKFLHHYPAKLLIRLLISRTKYYVIDIYLAYKQITIISLSKKSRINFLDLEGLRNEKISKAFISCYWSLIKPIEQHRKLVDMIVIPIILEARGLVHVYLLLDWPVEEGSLHVI
jgi:hypothetical protein